MEPDFLTVKDVLRRGWTRGPIERHLGPPDCLFAVDPWLNWSGKSAWHIDRVEFVETTDEFEAA